MLSRGIDNLEFKPNCLMPRLRILLRFLLIVTFCLEGSVSVWAASAMAVDNAHEVSATEKARPASIDEDCGDEASAEQGGAVHEECDCAQGLGCACACVFPVIAFVHAVPFAAQHSLASVTAVPARLPVVLVAITPVFRPPIG